MKSVEVQLNGIYLAEHLAPLLEDYCTELRKGCNPQHQVQLAWLAIPYGMPLEEAQASRIFETFGAWPNKEAA